jgi:hypothetical protein
MMSARAGDELRPYRYRLYIDESGDHSTRHLDRDVSRYLSLTGVWFRQNGDYREFCEALSALKVEFFGARGLDDIVLHRSAIINRRGPYAVLSAPPTRARFDAQLLNTVIQSKFRVVCTTVDKLEYLRDYTRPFDSYHYCLAETVGCYAQWLDEHGAAGDVMAESRGGAEDTELKSAFARIRGTGELVFDRQLNRRVLTSAEIKITPKSANVAGLQLADLLAHPLKQWSLSRRRLAEVRENSFGARLVEAVQSKLVRDEASGALDGFGLRWLPK